MGCPNCPENDSDQAAGRQAPTPSKGNKTIKCPKGHILCHLTILPSVCIKVKECQHEEKGSDDFCGPDCSDWSNELCIVVNCPICGKKVKRFISDMTAEIASANTEGEALAISHVSFEGNNMIIDMLVASEEDYRYYHNCVHEVQ